MAEPDPSAFSTLGWVELKSLSRAGPRPTPGWFSSMMETVQVVEHKIVGEVVLEELAPLSFSGLGEAGATRARRGQ